MALRRREDAQWLDQEIATPPHWVNCDHHPWSPAGVLEVRRAAASTEADIYHALHLQVFPISLHIPKIGILYDLTPLDIPETMPSRAKRAAFYLTVKQYVTRVDTLVLVSRQAAAAVVARGLAPQRVEIIPPGIDARFRPASREEQDLALSRLGLRSGAITWMGPFRPHKNVETVIRAYSMLRGELRRAHDLVLIGDYSTPSGTSAVRMAKQLFPPDAAHSDVEGRVCFPGFVADELLPALLSSASVFVFSSRAEGVGLPALEAAACGTPVVASAAAPVREFLGARAAYFEPTDARGLAALLRKELRERRQARSQFRASEHMPTRQPSWREAVFKLSQLYRQICRPAFRKANS